MNLPLKGLHSVEGTTHSSEQVDDQQLIVLRYRLAGEAHLRMTSPRNRSGGASSDCAPSVVSQRLPPGLFRGGHSSFAPTHGVGRQLSMSTGRFVKGSPGWATTNSW